MSHPAAPFVERIQQAYQANQIMLPELPEVAMKVREAIHSDALGIDKIARIIQLEPVLTARLIQIANSPLNRGSCPIEDCRAAVSRLGMSNTREIVTCLAMQNVFTDIDSRIQARVRKVWEHSSRVAAISYVLARVTPGLNEDTAMLAGLVHDIGVLPLLYYAADFPELLAQPGLFEVVVDKLRPMLGRAILLKWKFDARLIDVPLHAEQWQREHEGALDYDDIVILAQLHSFFGQPQAKGLPPLNEVPAFHRHSLSQLGPDASLELIDNAEHEIQTILRMLHAV